MTSQSHVQLVIGHPSSSSQKLHKEEIKYRQTLNLIPAEVDKYPNRIEGIKI